MDVLQTINEDVESVAPLLNIDNYIFCTPSLAPTSIIVVWLRTKPRDAHVPPPDSPAGCAPQLSTGNGRKHPGLWPASTRAHPDTRELFGARKLSLSSESWSVKTGKNNRVSQRWQMFPIMQLCIVSISTKDVDKEGNFRTI